MTMMIQTTNRDYNKLLQALADCGYYWVSGQKANQPPELLKQIGQSSDSDVVGIRCINTETRLVGYYPMEVLSKREQQKELQRAKTVNQAIVLLERIHHRDLSYLALRDGIQPSKGYGTFVADLRDLIFKQHQLDIVELVETKDEQVQFLKTQASPDAKHILCQDMDGLYQEYLGNLFTMEEFAQKVGIRYLYLLNDLDSLHDMETQFSNEELSID